MQPVLGEDHLGQEVRPGAPACDRVERSGRFRDRLARAAGHLLAHVLDDEPACRHPLQALGHHLAQLAHTPATARTSGGSRIDHARARQVLGKRTAGRLATRKAAHFGRLAGIGRFDGVCGSAAVSSRSSSESSSCSSRALRSAEGPNRSRRSRAISSFKRSISMSRTRRADLRLSASASAAIRAARSARIIAWALAKSEGSGAKAFVTPEVNHIGSKQQSFILSRPR